MERGNEEIGCNKELRLRPEEKEMGSKRGRDITIRSRQKIETCEGRRPPTQSRPRNPSHNLKSSYKEKGGRNLKLLSQL